MYTKTNEEASVDEMIAPIYADIKISHANDNKPSIKFIIKKVGIWLAIVSMLVGLLFI